MSTSETQVSLPRQLGLITFVSAFSLFLIQPVVGKVLTPAWGGTPSVWLSCLLFFQFALFIGYLFAWGGTTLYPRASFPIYISALILGLLLLFLNPPPLEPEPFWFNESFTSFGVIGYLCYHLFVIVLALSATSTVTHHVLGNLNSGRITRLYALSNAGSFLALFLYPFIIEPSTTIHQQIQIFTVLVVFQAIYSLFFWLFHQKSLNGTQFYLSEWPIAFPLGPNAWWWLFIPICTSALLCGVSNHISTEIASVPFLWIVPLGLYLLTYVIAFGHCPPSLISFLNRYAPVWVALLFFLLSLNGLELSSGTVLVPLFIHLGCFFVLCVLLHHLLLEKVPDKNTPGSPPLGLYYAIMSLGGLLGTLLQSLVFPIIFSRLGLWEYPLAIAMGIFLLGTSKSIKSPGFIQWISVGFIPLALGIFRFFHGPIDNTSHPTLSATITGVLFFICIALIRDWQILAASMLVGFLGLIILVFEPDETTEIRRNSFGYLKVVKTQKAGASQTILFHGNTIHGIQSEAMKDNMGRHLPLSYYGASGPVGDAFSKMNKAKPKGAEIGIIGLGVGSMAWFARPQDRLVFFELDPSVGALAEDNRFFDFLRQCACPYQLIFGDGRRSLNSRNLRFDLLVLDAFSSDTVPIHLLTREAMEGYLKRLDDNGTLLCHISNRHFDLLRLMKGWEIMSGQKAYLYEDLEIGPARLEQGFSPSQWIIFTKNESIGMALERDARWQTIPENINPVFWSDDHHSILGLLKW